jgi:hypothetical protein
LIRLLAGSVLLLAAGCRGDRQPPLVAGEGLVSIEEPRGFAVDPDRVPLIDAAACADGELVYRVEARRWSCVSAEALLGALPPEQAPAAADELEALAARVAALEASLAGLDRCAPLPLGQRPPDFVVAPSDCLITEDRGSRPNIWRVDAGWVTVHSSGQVNAYCPLLPRCDGSDHLWERLQVYARDPDGPGTAEQVHATIFRQWTVEVPDCPPGPCNVTSSEAGTSTLSLDLGGYRPDPDLTINRTTHWLQIELTSAGGGAAFGGAVIE